MMSAREELRRNKLEAYAGLMRDRRDIQEGWVASLDEDARTLMVLYVEFSAGEPKRRLSLA